MDSSIFSGLFLIFVITILIVFAYYTTTIIGKKTSSLMKNRYVQVLERTSLGLNIYIQILKINRKIYIVMIQGKNMEILNVIDEDDWEYIANESKGLFVIKEKMPGFFKKKINK